MNVPTTPIAARLNRRLVLAVALVVGLAAASLVDGPAVRAQPSPRAVQPPAAVQAPTPPAAPDKPKPGKSAEPSATESGAPTAEITVGPGGVTIDRHGKHVHVTGIAGDREFDSFDQLVREEPWLAGLIFFSVGLVFAVPVLIVIAVIWYKMRRARMLNETMLKLAERGVVPPAGAMDALAANKPEVAERMVVGAAPLAEQLRVRSRRTAWSDLRKGVVMLAIGLGLSVFSLMDDGTPNSIGLVLLFVGIGYVVLWRFEERQMAPRGGGPATGP